MLNPTTKAIAKISNFLNESGRFNDVTHKELQMINDEINGLNRNERKAAIAALSDLEIDSWAKEMESDALFGFGGLTDQETKELFDDVAEGLDGTQLKRLYSVLGDDNSALLSQSIAEKAGDQTKSEFISKIADLTTAKSKIDSTGLFARTSDLYNHDAHNAADILSSMNGGSQSFTDAMNSLSDNQLDAVLTAATEPTMMTTTGSPNPTYFFKTDSFSAIADRVADSKDAQLQGRFFEIGTKQIANIRDIDTLTIPNPLVKDEAGNVANALSKGLNSNVTGIVTELESNRATEESRFGGGMSSYIAELMRQGGKEDMSQIRSIVEKLKKGNDLQAKPGEYLMESVEYKKGNIDYPNLCNLGYLAGAVQNGIEIINADAQEKADVFCAIFGAGASIAGNLGGMGFKVGTVFGDVLVDKAVKEIADDVKKNNYDIGKALIKIMVPKGDEFETGTLSSMFDSARNRVVMSPFH